MTGFEHHQLRGITIKNIIVTIVSTAGIVASVVTTYFALRGDISEVRSSQETTNRVNEIRLKMLESEVSVLQQEVHELKESK